MNLPVRFPRDPYCRALTRAMLCVDESGALYLGLTPDGVQPGRDALARLKKETENWQGKTVKSLHLAAGYAPASEHPGLSAEKLVNEADMAMYAAKTAYYQETGLERRAQTAQGEGGRRARPEARREGGTNHAIYAQTGH